MNFIGTYNITWIILYWLFDRTMGLISVTYYPVMNWTWKPNYFYTAGSVADPDRDLGSGSGAFLTPEYRVQDPGCGMGKKSRSGSRMNIPDHISESLDTIFWVKNTSILWCSSPDPGSRNLFDLGSEIWVLGSGIRNPGWKNLDSGSGINILDPQH